MERVERHLSRGLSDTLGGKETDCFSRIDEGLEVPELHELLEVFLSH